MWLLAGLACSPNKEPDKTESRVEALRGAAPKGPANAVIPADVAQLLDSRRTTLRLPAEFEVTMTGEGARVDFWVRPADEADYVLGYDLGSEPADTSDVHPIAAQAMHVFLHNYAPADRVRGREPVGPATTLSPEVAAQFGADVVIRACFEPAEYLDGDFGYGVGYGFYKRDVGMAMVLLLTDDAGACADPADPAVFGFAYQ